MKRIAALTVIVGVWLLSSCSDPAGPPTPPPVAEADVILDPSKDNTLFEDPAGQLSNGSGFFLYAGVINPAIALDTLIRRALVHFDVAGSSIPAGSRIDSVQLVLRMDRTLAGDLEMAIHRVSADWGEATSNSVQMGGGMGAQAEAGDATWIHRSFPTDPWTNEGGDFEATASATATVGRDVIPYAWGSTNRMVQDVQGWLDDGANNFGWIVIGDESTHTTAKRFGAREEPTSANRPKLRIFYTEP